MKRIKYLFPMMLTALVLSSCTLKSNNSQNTNAGDGTVDPVTPEDTGVKLESFALNNEALALKIGSSKTLSPIFTPWNTTQKDLVWSSSNNEVATVVNGVVTAHSNGKAIITATSSVNPSLVVSSEISVDDSMDDYTILVYMCGSDLESDSGLATSDITEMLTNSVPEDVNIVLETGGAKSWKSKYGISASKTERYHIENKSLVKDGSYIKADMSSQATLQSFVEWGLRTYPAERTGLIMWNHGGGMAGVCYDENYNYGTITAAEMAGALKTTFTNLDRKENLEWIGYDACLMGVLDIATINSDYANYMIGAQETEDGYGWDYDTWLPTLYSNPKLDSKSLLSRIADTFISSTGGSSSQNINTLGVYDLSKIHTVVGALEGYVTSLDTDIQTLFTNVVSAKRSSLEFGENVYGNIDALSLLNNLKRKYEEVSNDEVINAIKELVVYNKYGGYYSTNKPCGICIFVAHSSDRYYGLQVTKKDYTTNDTKLSSWQSMNYSYGF